MTGWSGDKPNTARSLTGEPELLAGQTHSGDRKQRLSIGIGVLLAGIGIFTMLFRSNPQSTFGPATSATDQTAGQPAGLTTEETARPTNPKANVSSIAAQGQTTGQSFRLSVRQAMINNCDLQRVKDLQYEASFEYERCLLAIEGNLDNTCYLALKAQYFKPDEETVNAGCEIDI